MYNGNYWDLIVRTRIMETFVTKSKIPIVIVND